MNLWFMLIAIFLIGLLILIIGMAGKRRIARAVGLTSIVIVLVIAAVMIFVNHVVPVAGEVLKFNF
jgi:CHASE2 domain-containing sensor protein